MEALLGDNVQGKNGDTAVTSFSGNGKVVGLYFSAHWCPPCRQFTPRLAEWYNNFKKTSNGSNLEIVFVSSDGDEESFKNYYDEMPWLALPYSKRDKKAELSTKFKVQGIPTLVMLDGNGKVITTNGRNIVYEDPDGKEFPWTQKKFSELIAGKLINNKKEEVDAATALAGKVVAIYFSAHWCPPCKAFTPNLVKCYEQLKKDGKNFEIIFASSDREEGAFMEYFCTMPWLAIPFDDARLKKLSSLFDIEGIPMLVILDGDKVVTKDGRSKVGADLEGKDFPWHPKAVEELTNASAGVINDARTMILFTDESKSQEAIEMMEESGKEFMAKAEETGEDPEMYFLWAGEDEMVDSLLDFAKIPCPQANESVLVILDIPSQKKYVVPKDTKIDKALVKSLVADAKAGKLDFKPLRS